MSEYGLSYSLFEAVAAHLTGRPVEFRWQEPVWNNAAGACYKTLAGDAVLDLNPGAPDPLFTFLHECAHIRLNWRGMTPADYWRCEPGSIKSSSETRAWLNALPKETEADHLAAHWLVYAKKNAWRYYSQNPLENQLRALITYSYMELKNYE